MMNSMTHDFFKMLKDKIPDQSGLEIPPKIFTDMGGEIIDYHKGDSLTVRFQVQERYQNPLGSMQGGMIAAAVDNTIGPLSMLLAEPNMTHTLELEFLKPASGSLEYIDVRASLRERQKRRLVFSAEVLDPEQRVLAKATAIHLVVRGLGSSR